jgi:hypothetical protein
MHHPHGVRCASLSLSILVFALTVSAPELCVAQASPFMTGASALQTNILAWLTPIAIILVMVLGGMAMANRMASRTRSPVCENSEADASWVFSRRRRALLASPSYGFRASHTRSSGAVAAASSPNGFARITARASSCNARRPSRAVWNETAILHVARI